LPDPRAVRIARHTERLDEVVEFYRDGIGLIEIGGFRGHPGYDGVVLAVPDTGAHLELTAGGEHGVPVPHPESLFVLYLGDVAAVNITLRRLDVEPIAPANPYWAEHGVTLADPDGFRVVLVPEWWAPFGDGGNAGTPAAALRVDHYEGPRENLRPLFELAEDSQRELNSYIGAGRVLVAVHEGEVVGHLQITETAAPAQLQIRNMAVTPSYQRRGVGRALLAAAIALARDEDRCTLVVATAAADIGNLRFYQRLGFRMRSVERDAFTAATGYSAGLLIDGIELRDRVWLELAS
jgi:GNAT superfamily N-acetyltransferase